MKKLKSRIISYDRFLFILSTINPNNSPTIDIGINYKLNKIVASIGCSSYTSQPDIMHIGIADSIKSNMQHISKYSIHNI